MTITPVPRRPDESYPSSYAQVAMWLAERLRPDRTMMHVLIPTRLRGALDRDALAGAFADLVARHESLRTVFVEADGELRQVVRSTMSVPVSEIDLRAVPADQRDGKAHEVAERLLARPFDLATGPLLRVSLVRLADDDHLLLMVWHHLIHDGWSIGLAMTELSAHYARRRGAPVPELPPLPVQYVDYAVWQRERVASGEFDEAVARRREELSVPRPDAVLPCVPARPGGPPRGARRFMTLPGDLIRRLRQAARPLATTPFHLLLTGYLGLLARYTGCADLAVGVIVSGRGQPELEHLVGAFVNTMPVRVVVDEAATFRSLVADVRRATLRVIADQEVPYELFGLRDVGPPLRFGCLTQDRSIGPANWEGLTEEAWFHDFDDAIWDFSVAGWVTQDGFEVALQYRTDLFDEATALRFGRHLRTLLEAMAAEPDRPVSELPVLSDEEVQQAVRDWNPPPPEQPPAGVLDTIAAHARRTPEATALVDADGRELSYRETMARVRRVAARLRALGVRPGERVGVYLERSPEAAVAALGVMAARAAFLPVSDLAPPGRIAAQLDDAGARYVLTVPERAGALPPGVRALDVTELAAGGEPGERNGASDARSGGQGERTGGSGGVAAGTDGDGLVADPPRPDDLAYVIYTSGSTGAPKGVEVTHANLATTAWAWRQVLPAGPPRRWLQCADLAFDVFVSDLVRALGTGGAAVFCPRDVQLDPPRLHRFMRGHAVTAAFLVPAVARLLAEHLRRTGERLEFLKLLIFGVEKLYAEEFAEFVALTGPGATVLNSYGVTEATIDNTVYFGSSVDLPGNAVVPIGRPLPGTLAYVLDRHGRPCPIGVTGELYLGGDVVSRGYTGAPDLTAARFGPDPFRPGGRLYRTGDLARYHPDGNIELLGRVDHQVKVRGRRVEPGEVEAALRELPEVAQCVVVARELTPGEAQLVGYLVPAGELDVDAVRAALARRLPDYLVPAAFVVLPSLPLNANGKVDRSALPPPDPAQLAAPDYVAPSGPAEERLAEIWQDLLGLDRVGVNDNFVALGGHSLTAARLVGEVRAAFGVELPLPAVFEQPTVAAQARLVEELVAAELAELSEADALRLLEGAS